VRPILEIALRLALGFAMLAVLSLGIALILPSDKVRRAGKGLRVLGASMATGILALMFWLMLIRSGHAGWHG
jgi:hypothetical protein